MRLRTEREDGVEAQEDRMRSLVWHLSHGPIAESVETAAELPADFYALFLGPRMKYSCALWPPGTTELAQADDAMLELTCRRAGIEDGMEILDLGCGWGSLTLWIAERYPNARVTGVSSSSTRTAHIEHEIRGRRTDQRRDRRSDAEGGDVDRVLSVETFEHTRNWKELLRRISTRLEARRQGVHPPLQPPRISPTASRGRGRPSASSPAGRCRATTSCSASRTTSW
jgi:cyclopropane-fatty-acyl-phospholipid synthase